MNKGLLAKAKGLNNKKRTVIIGVAVVVLVLIVLLAVQMSSPKPSVAAYCKTYNSEKARLSKLPGDTWSSAVFNDSVSSAGELATSFDRLARVAPSDVKPDVVTLQKLYQKVNDDPSQAMSASLSGIGVENNVKTWTNTNCSAEAERK